MPKISADLLDALVSHSGRNLPDIKKFLASRGPDEIAGLEAWASGAESSVSQKAMTKMALSELGTVKASPTPGPKAEVPKRKRSRKGRSSKSLSAQARGVKSKEPKPKTTRKAAAKKPTPKPKKAVPFKDAARQALEGRERPGTPLRAQDPGEVARGSQAFSGEELKKQVVKKAQAAAKTNPAAKTLLGKLKGISGDSLKKFWKSMGGAGGVVKGVGKALVVPAAIGWQTYHHLSKGSRAKKSIGEYMSKTGGVNTSEYLKHRMLQMEALQARRAALANDPDLAQALYGALSPQPQATGLTDTEHVIGSKATQGGPQGPSSNQMEDMLDQFLGGLG